MKPNDATGNDRHVTRKDSGLFETNRRGFLKGAAAAGVTTTLFPSLARASGTTSDVTLVVVNLRGGADLWGSLCPPVADPSVQAARASLAIPAPAVGNQTVWIPSSHHGNQRFGLAQAGLGLKPALDAGDLVLASGVGLPAVSRSHFQAMREIEFGIDANSAVPSGARGWGGGVLKQACPPSIAPVRGLALGGLLPTTLLNGERVQAVRDLTKRDFPGTFSTAYPTGFEGATTPGTTDPAKFTSNYRLVIDLLHPPQSEPGTIGAAGAQAIDAFDYLDQIPSSAPPSSYPQSAFAQALHDTAVILGSTSPRPELIHIDFGGWDHHEQQGSNDPQGTFWGMCQNLCDSIGAFYAETQGQASEYLLMVYTEFGRRLCKNADDGTDHGHGNAMILLGDAVARGSHGGKIYAEFPELKPGSLGLTNTTAMATSLNCNEDLVINFEFRNVLYEFMRYSLGMGDEKIQAVFHGWTNTRTGSSALNLLG